MKYLFLINLFFLKIISSKGLLAQAMPTYSMNINKQNKLSLEKAIKTTFPFASIGALGVFLTTRIHPVENIPLRNFAQALEEPIEGLAENLEEDLESGATLAEATLPTLGFLFFISAYYGCFKSINNSLKSKKKPLEVITSTYKYLIKNIHGENICQGSRDFSFSSLDNLKLNWKDLINTCNAEFQSGEAYFIDLIGPLGEKIISGKKLISIFN